MIEVISLKVEAESGVLVSGDTRRVAVRVWLKGLRKLSNGVAFIVVLGPAGTFFCLAWMQMGQTSKIGSM
jgi:hypothetical protein